MPLWCLLKCIADKPSKHSILFWFSIINFLKNKYLRRSSDFLRSTQNFVQSSSCFVNLLSKPQNHEEIFFKFCVLLRKSKLYFSDNKMDPNEKVYLVKVGLNFIGIITFFKNIKILFKDVRFWKKSLSFDFPSSKLCEQIFIALLKKSNVPFQTEQKIIKQKMRMKLVSKTHPLNMNLTIKTLDRKKIMICQFIKWF